MPSFPHYVKMATFQSNFQESDDIWQVVWVLSNYCWSGQSCALRHYVLAHNGTSLMEILASYKPEHIYLFILCTAVTQLF